LAAMFVYPGAIYLRKFTKLLPLVLGRFKLKMFKVNFHINRQCNLRTNPARNHYLYCIN